MFDIVRYTPEHETEWDCFVNGSKNGTFLLKRGYMDYHADRFTDCSLLFYLKGRLYAALPANARGKVLYSHQGLTYGGLLMTEKCTAALVLMVFEEMNEWLRKQGFEKVVYKPIPHIYAAMPAEEDLYALFRCGATLTARGLSSSIDLAQLPKWQQNRRTALNKARKEGVRVAVSEDLKSFWQLLEENLQLTHGIRPVHTVEEMMLLQSRFPKDIVLMAAYNCEGKMLGGILLYVTRQVVHSQYISATPEGKANGAIDAIMHEVLQMSGKVFDFGISTEQGGLLLNESLIFQKEGFGGRGICYDTYEYRLSK